MTLSRADSKESGRTGLDQSPEQIVERLSFRRRVFFLLIIWIAVFSIAEIGARVGGYLVYGRSPYFLFYGFRSAMADGNPEGHTDAEAGYFKFPPNRTLHQYGLFSKPTPIRINNRGFRGADFSRSKPVSSVRITCLGESSTFGFYDSDGGTYPALLQRALNQGGGSPQYEVINAGIPHANSDNIQAMVAHEIIGYQPDYLTWYAGYNDAVALMAPSTLYKALTWIHGHFASYVALKTLVTKLGGPELPSRWSTQTAGSDSSRVNTQVRLHSLRYRANLDSVVRLARGSGIRMILIKQAVTTGWGDTTGVTYSAKVERAREALAKGLRVSAGEAMLVVHSALMGVLDSLASEFELPVIDNVSIVDKHPEYFASYVHLTEVGNLALANAIADVIAPPRQSGPTRTPD